MTKPRAEVRQKEYRQKIKWLYQTLNKLGSETKVRALLADLLTPAEQRMFHRRWHVALLLSSGHHVRQAAQKAKVSTLTVMKIKKLLENSSGGSLRQALTKAGQEKAPAKRVTRRRFRQASPRLTFGGVEEASE